MAGIITINFKVVKNGMADLGLKSPIYIPGPVEPQFGPGRYIYFEGFSVDEHGKQHYLDVGVAYRQTTLRKSFLLLLYHPPYPVFLSPPLPYSTLISRRRTHYETSELTVIEISPSPKKVSLSTSAASVIVITRSTSCCHVHPSRAILRVLWISLTPVRPSAYQWISSTLILCPTDRPRSWIWDRVPLRRVSRRARSRQVARIANIVSVVA